MNEIAITITTLSSVISYFYPSEIIVKYAGHGSKARTLSGKPLEIVRGKRLDSITIKFENAELDDFEYFKLIWDGGHSCTITSYMPQISATACFIELDGFGLSLSKLDKYSGEITFLVS